MLIRIVKMTFQPGTENDFLKEFEKRKNHIAGFKGCDGVELLRDINQPTIFFTYSKWKDETSLESYRNSSLFDETWTIVKKWFGDRPQAWSVKTVG
jgi:heme-degrading monooxygenase HmoA